MSVSVIIPTQCRRWEIRRAIDSVLAQDVPVQIIVVANGFLYEAALAEELRRRDDLQFAYIPEGSCSAAHRHGRRLVHTEWFAFLDDDDVYLPGALKLRLAALAGDPGLDLVVTNGYSTSGQRVVQDAALVNRDPFGALLRRNWLASGGALFRSERIGAELFDAEVPYYEWTSLAFRMLTSGKRMRFIDVPTYQLYDSPDSLSKEESEKSLACSLRLIEEMVAAAPPGTMKALRRKRNAAMHALSDYYLRRGELRKAWVYHLRSLRGHACYTRKLILPRVKS